MLTFESPGARYSVRAEWAGNTGGGAPGGFTPDHWVGSETLAPIPGTTGRGEGASPYRYNPEQLLVASISTGHMLAYLSLAAEAGLTVTAYTDRARADIGVRKGRTVVRRIILMPRITVAPDVDLDIAAALIDEAQARSATGTALNIDISVETTFERDARFLEVA
jgi:organic hydroperoxide reductase OsmC/OhrA